MIDESKKQQFETLARDVLRKTGIKDLQVFGREKGVSWATDKRKGELIDLIIDIYVGRLAPVPVSIQGAPVKNSSYNPKLKEQMDALERAYLIEEEFVPRLPSDNRDKARLVFESPLQADLDKDDPYKNEIYRGQLTILDDVYYLLPLDCKQKARKIIVDKALCEEYGLQNGDVLSGFGVQSATALVITKLLTVNGWSLEDIKRRDFDNVEYAVEPIRFYDGESVSLDTAKCLEWLTPVYKGQRVCLISAPKAGKTRFLLEVAQSAIQLNPSLTVLTLLVGQPIEEVGAFRKVMPSDNLIYSTYDDDPERQVFTADFMLSRAVSYAQSGMDVLLLVDSFTTLARAYNDTELSVGGKVLAGGLESKTLQYLRRFLGKARQLQQGGSLTIIGALTNDTGNPMDDLLSGELSVLSNAEIRLSYELAIQHIYPALDIHQSRGGQALQGIRLQGEKLIEALKNSKSKVEFLEKN